MLICVLSANIPLRKPDLIPLSCLVVVKYQQTMQHTILVIVHFTSCGKKFCSPQTHCVCIAGFAAVSEETTMPAVSKKRRISVPGEVDDTYGNIGRSEKHLDSSSVPDVADAIEVLSSKVMLVQSIHYYYKDLLGHLKQYLPFF